MTALRLLGSSPGICALVAGRTPSRFLSAAQHVAFRFSRSPGDAEQGHGPAALPLAAGLCPTQGARARHLPGVKRVETRAGLATIHVDNSFDRLCLNPKPSNLALRNSIVYDGDQAAIRTGGGFGGTAQQRDGRC